MSTSNVEMELTRRINAIVALFESRGLTTMRCFLSDKAQMTGPAQLGVSSSSAIDRPRILWDYAGRRKDSGDINRRIGLGCSSKRSRCQPVTAAERTI